jgi:RHS repeat-associated protein
MVQPNGVTTLFSHDLRGRLTGIEARDPASALLASYSYTLDAAGNRTRVVEHTGRTVSWQYDALSRLLQETIQEPGHPATTEQLSYDAVGNRALRISQAGSFPHSYDANDRLLSDGTATYGWDANGNLTSRSDAFGTTTYGWDAKDRLVEVNGLTTGLVEHAYDHRGDRVETRVNGVASRYLVDANRALSQVIEERDAGGALLASYVHGDRGEPLSRYDGVAGTVADLHHDAQGSVRQLTDALASVTDSYAYSAFGELLEGGADPNPYRYAGQWEDPQTGLYHLRARWMDPRVGRFLTSDPFEGFVGTPRTLNKYLYADSNPVSRTDPSGEFSLVEVTVVSSIAGSLATVSLGSPAHAAPSTGSSASGSPGGGSSAPMRPRFTDLLAAYPAFPSPDVYALVGGAVLKEHLRDPEAYANACALRVSRALNYSGAEIRKEYPKTLSGSDGKWYYFNLLDFVAFLTRYFGPPDIKKSKPARTLDFLGKRGIIIFDTRGAWPNATGHADLWTGAGCAWECYFPLSNEVSLWKMP